jgi:predicted ATPase/class 3 adenylate cyclase
VNSVAHAGISTFLFTDIEGSSRLWQEQPELMPEALARHDAILRTAVACNRGVVVKTTGDGLHAAFDDPHDAIGTAVEVQRMLATPGSTGGLALSVRCGIHAGVVESRDGDFFGTAVNLAARITSAAHGGQVLVSRAVAVLVGDRLREGLTLRDLGAVRLRDLTNPERVYQLVHPDLRQDFPVLRSLESTPNNLPHQLTSFIGREPDIAEARQLLAKNRLLTLVGAGGIGKTRLSLQVAASAMDAFPDGVWLVELATVNDPRLVPQAVAFVLGVKQEAGRPLVEVLSTHVSGRRLLVILDNCEHLLQACAELARAMLRAGAEAKILASSREPLHVAGEAIFPVPPLPVPGPNRAWTRNAVEQYDAVRMFAERALAAQSTFSLTDANATSIATICQRLDGIPLALELAAARVRAMSAEQIAARLSDRFRLLTGGDRTALPRQQTLRALIDWSYDLLTDAERQLLRRLTVFAGSFTLEAVEAVTRGSDLGAAEPLDLLSELVEKSLVVMDPDTGRYRLLETVRQYAREKLAQSGEADAIRSRHLAFFAAFAEQARPELVGPRQAAWLARLDLESENILSALAWSDGTATGAATALQLLHSMKNYVLNRGLLAVGLQLTLETLARPGAQTRDLLRCRGLFNAGQYCCAMGQYAEAQPLLEESLAIAREIGDKERIAMTLQPLGEAVLGQGNRDAARQYLEEAVALARELPDRRELAAALNALAQLRRIAGTLATAEPLYQQAVALARELGDRESVAIGLLNLAMVAIGRGSGDSARKILLEALVIGDEIGSKPVGQSVIEVAAGLSGSRGESARAARWYGAAEAHAAQTGLHRDPADEAFLAPHVARARAELGADLHAAAETAGRALGYAEALSEVRAWLKSDP